MTLDLDAGDVDGDRALPGARPADGAATPGRGGQLRRSSTRSFRPTSSGAARAGAASSTDEPTSADPRTTVLTSRPALVQGRDHLRGARPRLLRQRRRRHRRLPRPDREARLPAGPRRHRDLAAAVLPVAAARRRLRHRRLHRRQPAYGTLATSRSSSTRPTAAACGSSPSWSSTTPPTSTPGSSAPAAPAGQRRARLLRLERHAGDATRTRASSSRTSSRPTGPGTRSPGAYYWHRFYSHQPDLNFDNPASPRHAIPTSSTSGWRWASTACGSTPCPTSTSARAPTARTCPRRTPSSRSCARTRRRALPGPHAAGRGQPVAGGRRRLLRRRRRVPHGLPLPGDAAAVHGDPHGGPLPDRRHPRPRRRRSPRTASGRCSCATTTS